LLLVNTNRWGVDGPRRVIDVSVISTPSIHLHNHPEERFDDYLFSINVEVRKSSRVEKYLNFDRSHIVHTSLCLILHRKDSIYFICGERLKTIIFFKWVSPQVHPWILHWTLIWLLMYNLFLISVYDRISSYTTRHYGRQPGQQIRRNTILYSPHLHCIRSFTAVATFVLGRVSLNSVKRVNTPPLNARNRTFER
jgi:hypothetical protein